MSYFVKDYMSRDVVTIDIDASALTVSKLMENKGIGYIIVDLGTDILDRSIISFSSVLLNLSSGVHPIAV